MRRLLTSCLLSILIYAGAGACLLDRPLSYGFLRAQLDAKLVRGAAIAAPKLVIIAGSNGPYSHRCETMEPIVMRPCVNAGVAVGIGLDYIFTRWRPALRRGDWVYLPLEQEQYVRSIGANRLGPDASMMIRHDWRTLSRLSADRWLAALFTHDLRAILMAGIETMLVATGFQDPRARVTGSSNSWGDHIGHSLDHARMNAHALRMVSPTHQSADRIEQGHGRTVVTEFLRWARANGVVVIGGFATGFDDSPMPTATASAIRRIFDSEGAPFLQLPNNSRYPRDWFFDTADHLHESAQIAHSGLIAAALHSLMAPPVALTAR